MTRDEEHVDYFEVAKEIVMAETRAIKIERITNELEELLWEVVLEQAKRHAHVNVVSIVDNVVLDDMSCDIGTRLEIRLSTWQEEQEHEASQRAARGAALQNTEIGPLGCE